MRRVSIVVFLMAIVACFAVGCCSYDEANFGNCYAACGNAGCVSNCVNSWYCSDMVYYCGNYVEDPWDVCP